MDHTHQAYIACDSPKRGKRITRKMMTVTVYCMIMAHSQLSCIPDPRTIYAQPECSQSVRGQAAT